MRILVAPQEFKGSLTARQAAESIAAGLGRALPEAQIRALGLADGGPGTVEALVEATGGRYHETEVRDPLGLPIRARWGVLGDGKTAVIEMAAASGLSLLRSDERDPRVTSTYGTGELIHAALDGGYRRIIVGAGGSATNDGGAGMAQALGARLRDEQGRELPPGGAELGRLAQVDTSGLDPRLVDGQVVLATDVANPLCGPAGASLLFGAQKGATPEVAAELDAALAHYADVIERDLGAEVRSVPGAGAAGGLGAGLIAFLRAEVRPGFEVVAEAVGLGRRIEEADLVVTGEGRLDRQTGFGKTPAGVARMARNAGRPVVAIVGAVEGGYASAAARAFDAVISIASGPMPLEELMANAGPLLEAGAESLGRWLAVGRRLS